MELVMRKILAKVMVLGMSCTPFVISADEIKCDCRTQPYDSYLGVWESSYGHMFFTDRTSKAVIETSEDAASVRAAFWSYPDSHGMADNGRLVGTVTEGRFEGYWIQDSGENPCETEKEGSLFWGITRFEANADFTELTGSWGFCDEEPTGDDSEWLLWRDEIRDWVPPEE
jgi:hypothetical protein